MANFIKTIELIYRKKSKTRRVRRCKKNALLEGEGERVHKDVGLLDTSIGISVHKVKPQQHAMQIYIHDRIKMGHVDKS